MSGETSLEKLLAGMAPELEDEDYVFCTFQRAVYGDLGHLEPIAAIAEKEGLTLVIPRSSADRNGLSYDSVFRRVSLGVHSSLDAVGLTAALAGKLGQQGICANVIAGYYHDHIFVPRDLAEHALQALQDLAR